METKSMKNQEWFEQCVKESKSIIDAIIRLGYDTPSNFYRMFHKYQKLYNTDISHFLNRSELMMGKKISFKYTLEDILVENFIGSVSGNHLKKKLYDINLKQPCCELCGQDENWITGKISMIIDHINGNNKDNRIENLRIICPNCDAALPTFKGKNKKKVNNSQKMVENMELNFHNEKEILIQVQEFIKILNNYPRDIHWRSRFCNEFKWSKTKLINFLIKHNLQK
jgi:hypothetical protein